jgi:protein O-mannosyl-transferase
MPTIDTKTPGSDSERRPFPAVTVLTVLAVLALSPVLAAGYIRFDDYANLLDNANVQHFSAAGLGRIWTTSALGFYIPLTYSVWWFYAGVAGSLGTLGQSAPLFHALNLAVHVLNASIVFRLTGAVLRRARTTLPPWQISAVALVSAACFALHPAQVETVAWVTELKGLLAGLLGLLAIATYYRGQSRVLTGLLFVAAMLSKPSAVVFPAILLLADRILFGKGLRDSAKTALGFLLPLVPFVLVTKYLQPAVDMEYVPTLPARLLVAADTLSFYLAKLLVPARLGLDYGRSPQVVLAQVPAWQLAGAGLLFVAGVALVSQSLLRPRDAAVEWTSLVRFGAAVFCLSLLPVLGLVPFAFQDYTTVADHYLYIPILGASFVVAGLLLRARAPAWSLALAAALVLGCAAQTFAQARHWRSNQTLFEHTLAVNPSSYLAHYSIGTELLEAGKTEDGVSRMLACLRLRPTYLSGQLAVGVTWLRQGQPERAIAHYQAFLATQPSTAGKRAAFMASIHNTLGTALCQVGRVAEGAQHFRQAIALDAGSVMARMNLGRVALGARDFTEAAAQYQAALALDPGNAEIARLLAVARRYAQPQ